MLKEYTCIICPNSCTITAQIDGDTLISLQGGDCKRGQKYVTQEITNPLRTISSSVLIKSAAMPLVSVRLSAPIPKARIFDVMKVIRETSLTAPVSIGQIVIKNVLGLNSDVIVTKNIPKK